jgi:hypothetical protein
MYVCDQCADDEYLAEAIRGAAEEEPCDFCEREGVQCAPLDVLIEAVQPALDHYWTDPANELPFESREGGYQGSVYSTREVLCEQIGMDWPENLVDSVVGAIECEFWCKRHYFSLSGTERLRYGWRDFDEEVKHRSRYASLLPPLEEPEWHDHDSIPPSEMLDEVGHCIRECGLIKTIAEDHSRGNAALPGAGTRPHSEHRHTQARCPLALPSKVLQSDERGRYCSFLWRLRQHHSTHRNL